MAHTSLPEIRDKQNKTMKTFKNFAVGAMVASINTNALYRVTQDGSANMFGWHSVFNVGTKTELTYGASALRLATSEEILKWKICSVRPYASDHS